MLRSISIHGYKSIQALEGFDLRNLNVLIGPNGAGKTNFVSLFHMLAEMFRRRLQVFVTQSGGPDALLFGGRKITRHIDAKFAFGKDAYEVSLVPAGDRLVFAEETMVSSRGWSTPRRELGSGHLEAQLPEVTGDTFAAYVEPLISNWRIYHFHDTSRNSPMRQPQAVRDNIAFKSDAGNLAPFLRMLREDHPEDFRRILDAVRMAAPFFGDFIYRRSPGERMELEWFHADDPDTPRGPQQLSDGTLRFICLATLLLQPSHLQSKPTIIDEPELGLHPDAVTLLGALLRRQSSERQLIVSTQSADLVSQLEPEDIVVVERRDGESVFERLDLDRLDDWLKDYPLGDLWRMNVLGGRPESLPMLQVG